jgi:glycosyltransferase involved in cell wall biosynthesis
LVNDGIDGILVPPSNPEAIADAALKILQEKELALHLSRASRDKIVTSFTYQRSATAIARNLPHQTSNRPRPHKATVVGNNPSSRRCSEESGRDIE